MTNRLKKDIIKLVIDEVVIDGEKLKIAATIPLPNKIQEREIVKADLPDTFNAGATLGPINQTKMERIWTKHKQINTTLKPKVFVAMSGGVDSSVAALSLQKEGYDVTGVFIKTWNYVASGCGGDKELEDARLVCEKLNIPFFVFDFSREYKTRVADYMIEGYRRGITPNPDVMCNKEIKFGLFFEKARTMGADFIATGHYVRKWQTADGKWQMTEAVDKNKDQSYFLWAINPGVLGHCLFPVGEYRKDEIRGIAKAAGLPVAEKKDSQGICFLGKVDMNAFLRESIGVRPGVVRDVHGRVLGKVSNINFYTEGQRHGLDIQNGQGPYFVVAKDAERNAVVVAHVADAPEIAGIEIRSCNFFSASLPERVEIRTRYRQKKQNARVVRAGDNTLQIEFSEPQKFIARGQSGVLYSGTHLLGGGIVEEVIFGKMPIMWENVKTHAGA